MIKHMQIQKMIADPESVEEIATRLAHQYHRGTEIYDRRLPGQWSTREIDSWLPRGSLAQSMSLDFAVRTFRESLALVLERGSTKLLFCNAVRDWRGNIPRDEK